MYNVVSKSAFPFMKGLGAAGSAYARHMRDAIFKIPTAAMLARVVDMFDKVPMEDRDTKGDVYEYMLAASSLAMEICITRHLTRWIEGISCVSSFWTSWRRRGYRCDRCYRCHRPGTLRRSPGLPRSVA
jgi:hypothetical protein